MPCVPWVFTLAIVGLLISDANIRSEQGLTLIKASAGYLNVRFSLVEITFAKDILF